MLEEQCREIFKNACQKVIDDHTHMARLKGYPKPKNEFEEYFSHLGGYSPWDGQLVKRVCDARKDDPIRDAFLYFTQGKKLRDAYIRKKYGTIEDAMRQTGTFSKLFDGFLEDFSKERIKFMEDMQALIDNAKQTALSQKRSKGVPRSHGGVANLLKVLTQTMKAQGSSIKTIAKVQYAVCMQAGILIPDEFITDVLVSANIEEGRGR